MEYQDFTIDLRSTGDGRFEATVADAPIRENPRVFFSPPIEKKDLESLHGAYDRPGQELQQASLPGVSPRKLGGQLYSALFCDELADLFLRCRASLAHQDGAGLRLRLRFQINDLKSAAGYLASLPWEWLYDPKSGTFLSSELRTPVVRDISAAQLRRPLDVVPPLRILVVDAAPETMKKLNLKLEIDRMSEALGTLVDAGQVELLRLDKAHLRELRDALKDEEIHVLHFMGHGGYDPESGYGAVFFVKDGGEMDEVEGEILADHLKDLPSLRLVVLNACKTARHAGREGAPLYYGAASAILERTGVPAVVANQYSISDAAAVAFSEAFYGRIAKGDPVDEALTETRLRFRARSSEWATPVLFMTSRNGKLFAMEQVPRQRNVREVTRSRPEESPLGLGVRSFDGYGGDMKARNHDLLDLVPYFNGRAIQEKPWWQEKVFPELRDFLRKYIHERRPILLDFAAHSSIAFAAGWVLEPKSGLDVRVRQRIGNEGEFEWHPKDGSESAGDLWQEREDIVLDAGAPDVALALSASQPDVAAHVKEFVETTGLKVGRIVDAVIAPEPGPRSVRGGAHALRLAQALLPRVRQKHPHERGGRVHLFCAAPNALVFYLGQLASSLEKVVLYEFPFRAEGAFGRYQKSIELPPPGEAPQLPPGW
ncbi:MAG TPA: SAVED domain-containing protein [Thermoanaerobaculia bacterium]